MAPQPVPNPWSTTPAPGPANAPTNSWSGNPWQGNIFDVPAQLDALNQAAAVQIKELFGRDMRLTTLIDLFAQLRRHQISDADLVTLIEMGIYFARHTLLWPEAANNLEYWLNAGATPTPVRIMDHRLFMDLAPLVGTNCDEIYAVIVSAVHDRLTAPAGTKFPAQQVTLTGPSGEAIVLTPAASPLADGGVDVLYKEISTPTSLERNDVFNAVGAVTLNARVTVKSERLDTAGWRVTIVSWESWIWDTYDWNEGVGVSIPVRLFDRLGVAPEKAAAVRDALSTAGVDPGSLDELGIKDEQMKQLEGKTIQMPDGRVIRPKAYLVLGDSSWPFDVRQCGKDVTWLVTP